MVEHDRCVRRLEAIGRPHSLSDEVHAAGSRVSILGRRSVADITRVSSLQILSLLE